MMTFELLTREQRQQIMLKILAERRRRYEQRGYISGPPRKINGWLANDDGVYESLCQLQEMGFVTRKPILWGQAYLWWITDAGLEAEDSGEHATG